MSENLKDDIEITFSDIIKIADGIGVDGRTKSTGSLNINEIDGFKDMTQEELENIDESKVKTVKQIILTQSVFNIYVSGGCAVLDIDIPVQSGLEYRSVMDACSGWFNRANDSKYDNQFLSFTLVPLLLGGQITIVFQELVYYSGIQTDEGFKVILCFDGNLTNCVQLEGVDVKSINMAIAEEIRLEEEQLDMEIAKVQAEVDRLKEEQNPYARNIRDMQDSELGLQLNDTVTDDITSKMTRIVEDE